MLDTINTKFLNGFKCDIDISVFNPPYVPTPSEECNANDIRASWAGGVDGREVIDELLEMDVLNVR